MDEPPLLICCMMLAVVLLLIWPGIAVADPGPSPAWYYGDGTDGYLGRRHAASWHGKTPVGMPETVEWGYLGVATGDWSISFGTRLCITVVGFPAWSEGEYDHLVGNTSWGIVVDRMPPGYEAALDCWPALFKQLAGEDWRRIGKVNVVYETCDNVREGKKEES